MPDRNPTMEMNGTPPKQWIKATCDWFQDPETRSAWRSQRSGASCLSSGWVYRSSNIQWRDIDIMFVYFSTLLLRKQVTLAVLVSSVQFVTVPSWELVRNFFCDSVFVFPTFLSNVFSKLLVLTSFFFHLVFDEQLKIQTVLKSPVAWIEVFSKVRETDISGA